MLIKWQNRSERGKDTRIIPSACDLTDKETMMKTRKTSIERLRSEPKPDPLFPISLQTASIEEAQTEV